MTLEDIKHLEWIYNRMIEVHGEREVYDYMQKFNEIIAKQAEIQRRGHSYLATKKLFWSKIGKADERIKNYIKTIEGIECKIRELDKNALVEYSIQMLNQK